jgi:hypothetical protein
MGNRKVTVQNDFRQGEVPSSVRGSSISTTEKSNRGNSSDSVDTRVLFSSLLGSQENWVSLPPTGTEGRVTGNCSSPKGGVSNIQGSNNLFTRPRLFGTFITSFLMGFLRTRSLGNKHFPPLVRTCWGGERPPLSDSPIPMSQTSDKEKFRLLSEEVQSLLLKRVIEEIPLTQLTPGFYSRLFLVPKKTGGMRPVIDLSIRVKTCGATARNW